MANDRSFRTEVAVKQLHWAKALYDGTDLSYLMAGKSTVPRCECGKALDRGLSARSLCADCRSEKKASR